jgi:hypothetical protein
MMTADMTAYVSLFIGMMVAVTYIIVLFRGFDKTKREMSLYGGGQLGETQLVDDEVFDSQEDGVLWKAAAGLVLSTLVLMLLLASPMVWYVVPFLSFGTAIAVIVAFSADRDTVADGAVRTAVQPT